MKTPERCLEVYLEASRAPRFFVQSSSLTPLTTNIPHHIETISIEWGTLVVNGLKVLMTISSWVNGLKVLFRL